MRFVEYVQLASFSLCGEKVYIIVDLFANVHVVSLLFASIGLGFCVLRVLVNNARSLILRKLIFLYNCEQFVYSKLL